MKSLFKKKDTITIALILLSALLLFLLPKLGKSSGTSARVIYDGQEVLRIPLSQDGTYTVEGDLTATLEVSGGRIRFINSLCPDKLCEGFGWISLEGETAVCMPAKLAVIIVN